MKIHFITLVDKNSVNKTENLKKTLYRYELNITDTYDPSLKNLSKIFKTFEYINSRHDFLENDILCIVDGHDVLFNQEYTDKDLIDCFKSTNKDMIISGELAPSHHCPSIKPFFEKMHKDEYKYPNSGVIICYKWAYLKMFRDVIKNFEKYRLKGNTSDQRILGLYIKDCLETNTLPISLTIDDNGMFTTTITTIWNGKLESIRSFFVHVTYLSRTSQYKRYQWLLDKFTSWQT